MQEFAPFQFWRTIAIISHIQLLCSCFLLLLKTIQPYLPLWSMAHKDLRHHSWTIPGNAKHLMLKIHPWCGSAAQSIITQLGLTRVNNFGPGMDQQSQPNPIFLVWNIDLRSIFFSFFVLMMTKWRSSPEHTPVPDILNSHLSQPRTQAELLIAIAIKNWGTSLKRLQTVPRQPVIDHTNSLSLSGQIQTFQTVLKGIFLTWLHNKCLSLWVRLWPHRLVRVCNYSKMYSCQQHTIFNTSLAFRVKLTLHSQILPSRQHYPNWDFRDFVSREGRSLHLWF